jgi:hypothetical protein
MAETLAVIEVALDNTTLACVSYGLIMFDPPAIDLAKGSCIKGPAVQDVYFPLEKLQN